MLLGPPSLSRYQLLHILYQDIEPYLLCQGKTLQRRVAAAAGGHCHLSRGMAMIGEQKWRCPPVKEHSYGKLLFLMEQIHINSAIF